MLSGLFFRSVFVFSINSLILSGFPLTSFRLAKASLSAFSWLYTNACAVVQKYHKMYFIYNYSRFKYLLVLKSTCFICTTWKRKQTMEEQPRRAYEQTKSKQIQNQVTSHSNQPSVLLFDLVHKQCNGIIEGWLHCLTSESKGRFLVNNLLKVHSCKLSNNKYTMASTQITNPEIFAFTAVLVFKLLSPKVLFIKEETIETVKK